MRLVSSLKQALTLNYILAAILPVAIFALITINYVSNYLVEDVVKDNLFLAGELRAQAEDFLERPVEILGEVSKVLYLGPLTSDDGINEYLEREVRNSDFFESIYILDQNGRVANLGVSRRLEHQKQDYYSIDLSSHELYQEELKQGQIFWSDTFVSVVTGEPSITIGMPYRDQILVGSLSLNRLNRVVARFSYAENLIFAVIDRKGSLIAHSEPEMALQRVSMMYHPEVRRALESNSNVQSHVHEDESMLESVIIIPQTGWIVWVGRDLKAVFEPITQVRNFLLLILALSFFGGVGLSFINSKKIMRPISGLVDAVDRLADGSYDIPPPAESYREVDNLVGGFNRMALAVVDREQSIRERETRFRNLVNSIEGIVWEYDIIERQFTFVSRHCEQMLGCTYQQWLSSPDFWEQHIHPDDRQWVVDYFQGLVQGRLSPQFEFRMLNTDGDVIWMRNMVNVVRDEGRPARLYGVIIDINDRKNSEIALRDSELRFRSLVEQAADIILIHDQNGAFVEVNEQACRSYCFTRNELLTMSMRDIEVAHDPLRGVSLWTSVQHGNSVTIESEHRRKDGSCFPVEVRLGSFLFQDAPLYLALVRDVSERKRADAALRESEERFRNYFELGLIGMVMTRLDGSFIEFNDRLCEICGYGREELFGKTWGEIAHPDDAQQYLEDMRDLKSGKIKRLVSEKRFVTKSGEVVFASTSVTGVRDAEGQIDHTIALIEDVTQRKIAEQALLESEEQVRLLLDSTAEGIYAADPDGICTLCNPAALKLLGFESEDEVVGQNIHDLIHHSALDGTPISRQECSISQVANTKESAFSDEEVFWRADGTWFHVEYRAHPILKEGALLGEVVTFHDITEQKMLQQQSIRTAQLASLGELAAGVAHEINNPINGVINYAQILMNRLEKSDLDTDLADRIIREGERIATIVRDLLFFAREGGPEMRLSNAEEILGEALSLTEAQIRKEGIHLLVNPDNDLPDINTRAQQIQQLFLNILSNARHALNEKYPGRDDRKKIEIALNRIEKGNKQFVRITFKDYGVGIPERMLEKIMNPFVTTKPAGVGTGLGLSISHEIVNKHNGDFRIKSEEGEWTEVTVTLPAAEKDIE